MKPADGPLNNRASLFKQTEPPQLGGINDKGISTVWDELFDTDEEANAAFSKTLEDEGMEAFRIVRPSFLFGDKRLAYTALPPCPGRTKMLSRNVTAGQA